MFRTTPNTQVIRPADASEIKFAWVAALTFQGPTILALARQNLPDLGLATDYHTTMARGAYIVRQEHAPLVILYASGSEVALALEVWERLCARRIGARVISVPCFELFQTQDQSYKSKILHHQGGLAVSIEAADELGWHQFIGQKGLTVSMNDFGRSDAPQKVGDYFGFHAELIEKRILDRLNEA